MMKRTVLLISLMLAFASAAVRGGERSPAGDTTAADGEVRVPLSVYQSLLSQVESAAHTPRPAPARFAIGKAQVSVEVTEQNGSMSGTVTVQLTARTFENQWTLVPVLPAATAVTRVQVDGSEVALITSADGLAWTTEQAGNYRFDLQYRVDAQRSTDGNGYVLAVPLPPGAAAELSARLPGSGLDVAVIPAVATTVNDGGGSTNVTAGVPPTRAVQISWRMPSRQGHVLSRASYVGTLRGDAMFLDATFDVELFTGEAVTLPLLPRAVTLSDLAVDGKRATVHVAGAHYAALLKGRGNHTVKLSFEAAVNRQNGPPSVALQIPEVPVSNFVLTLPGDKQLSVSPAASVSRKVSGASTVTTVFIPMTSAVTFTWTEAIPAEVEAQLSANASLYHAAHAEEGVLYVHAMLVWEITRGETNTIQFQVPDTVQINRIQAKSGGISDWRVSTTSQAGQRTVSVFLDRKVKGEFPFDVEYERLLGAAERGLEPGPLQVPLLTAIDVHRQRGMIALLSGPELALNPESEERVSKVGENQLPSFVRDAVQMTIAHTYKYTDAKPLLTVRAVAPEHKQGKFDAQVDTLVSIGEVTLKGSATIEVNVKSGSLMDLELKLPKEVTFLGLTGPSLRTHDEKRAADGSLVIAVAFTQEMEGQFRLEVSYEGRMLNTGVESEVVVPTVAVAGAEVEHGRIAVEALTTVEVQGSRAEQLSPVDVNELPQQLVLKTTNPILLAYKYVSAEPPYQLALKVTRHQEISVQDATIDLAHYRTLFTRDGSAVTTVRYTVRNSRRQFLRVELPPNAEPWSVFVAGKVEKPALATGEAGAAADPVAASKSVLIKLINSADGFPVEMVYMSALDKMGPLGTIRAHLPRLQDMVVTNTRWDVFLPDSLSYRELETNMEILTRGAPVEKGVMSESVQQTEGDVQVVQPLRIAVPARGVMYSFEKVYANQSEDLAHFELSYSSAEGERRAWVFCAAGALLFWVGLGLLLFGPWPWSRRGGLAAIIIGLLLFVIAIGYYGTSWRPAFVVSMIVVAGFAAWRLLAGRIDLGILGRLRRPGASSASGKPPEDADDAGADGDGAV